MTFARRGSRCILCCLATLLAAPFQTTAQRTCTFPAPETAQACSSTEVLKPLGVTLGTCVDASTYSEPQDIILEDPNTDDPPVVVGREGGKGYFVDPEDKAIKMCPLGYYCPLNTTTNVYDRKIKCGDGDWCWTGSVEPKECGPLIQCTKGCQKNAGPLAFILFVVLSLAMLGLCVCTRMRENMMFKQSRLSLEEHMDDSLEDFGAKFKPFIKPVGIEFENMGMTIKGAKAGTPPILQGISGQFPPGALTALMGPSGCGKTTFMNAVIDRAPYGNITGKVKVNGVPNGLSKAQNTVGFVPQDDIVHGDLTVYQNLYYHGKLRLPASTSNQDLLTHVANCISVLGLTKIQNNIVGTPEQRGVSGGQKKRVNIGLELVAMPSIIFMDEPTSGLDGAATVNIAKCLGQLKRTGITIICVIHQPRWLVFKEFTHLLLLGEGGRQIYVGRTQYMVPYMTDIGFRPAEGENPADWMIDVCSNLEKRYKPNGEVDTEYECPRDLYKEWAEKWAGDAVNPKSKWYQGDSERPEFEALVPRQTLNCCGSSFWIAGRIFRKTKMSLQMTAIAAFFFLGLLDSIGNIVAMTQDCAMFGWELFNMRAENTMLFIFFVNMQHRSDYGQDKIMINREINSGVNACGIWLARTIKSSFFGTIKIIVFCLIRYLFAVPEANFFEWTLGYIMLGNYWIAFAQVVSLACKDQMTAVLLLLVVPLFESLLSGMQCRSVMSIDSIAAVLCPEGENFVGGMATLWFPGLWFWKMSYISEIKEFPDYVDNFPLINMTTYWYGIPNTEQRSTGTTICGTEYTSVIYAGTREGWWDSFITLLLQNIYFRLIVLALLAMMSSSNNRWVADKISRCTYCCYSLCGLCHITGYSVPYPELVRATSADLQGDNKVGEPVKVNEQAERI